MHVNAAHMSPRSVRSRWFEVGNGSSIAFVSRRGFHRMFEQRRENVAKVNSSVAMVHFDG
jgi:hypothetical protein